MMDDARNVPAGSVLEADVCIVGAGAAGITLARELHRQGRRVILLESGGLEKEETTEALNYGGRTQPFFGRLEGARLRFFGGTTNHWSGFSAPFEPEDFQRRSFVPYSGWPIAYDEVRQYYPRALAVLQQPETAMDTPPARPALAHPDVVQKFRFINPLRFGQVYRQELVDSEFVRVLLHANAVGVEPEGRGVGAVQCATLEGGRFRVKAARFVLACGTLENTRLLLFWQDSPLFDAIRGKGWLGSGFMQHPHIDVGHLYYSARYKDTVLHNHEQFEDHLAPTPAFREARRVLNFTLGLYDYRETGWDNEVIPQYMERLLAPKDPFAVCAQIRVRSEQAPSHDNHVRLTGQRDALGVPQLDITWGFDALDIKTVREAAQLMARVAGANGMGLVRYADWMRGDGLPDYVWGGHHHMGTTRMSATPDDGVVDTQCRVHGTENLYVTGGGVFPSVGWANPTFTIVALALRLGDHLQQAKA